MEDKKALRLGHAYEEDMEREALGDMLSYGNKGIEKHSNALISGDFKELREVYFLKGQIAGIMDMLARPQKVIRQMREVQKKRAEQEKKKKEKKE